MKIGQKVTVLFLVPRPLDIRQPPTKFLRCYVIRRLSAGWQLYDPVRNWSWGLNERQAGERVIVA
jgi:hypothetical protein